MSTINVSGHVRYNNHTSATGAKVRLRDLDSVPGVPGNENDIIFNAVTDARGRFRGLTDVWRDREAQVLGVNVPDVLRLEFTVTVDGQPPHSGPFLQQGGASVPIVLPFGPKRLVSKAERELVQVILVADDDYTGGERALYEFIELASETLTQSILGGHYARTTFVTGSGATLAGVVGALRAATTRPGIKAVDLLFTTHGDGDSVVLFDGKVSDTYLAEVIVKGREAKAGRPAVIGLPPAAAQRLRTVFSTACFGRSHLDGWRAAGFTDASGSKGIYADSAVSYAPFLTAWASEATFAEAVGAANAADVGDIADSAARAFYTNRAESTDLATAAAIDSSRVCSGPGTSRLYSTP